MSTDEFSKIDFTNSGKDLLASFVKFSADVGNVEKNKANPHFKSTYADLAGAMNATREHLSKHELSVMQHPFSQGPDIGVTTLLIHSSGQYLSSVFLMRPVANNPQAFGSAVTYARRYAFMAILGIAPEDDDGNAATAKPSERKDSAPAKRSEGPVMAKIENFDKDNDEHCDRLELQFVHHRVPKDLWKAIADDYHGKPMLPSALKASIEKACGAGYLEQSVGESA